MKIHNRPIPPVKKNIPLVKPSAGPFLRKTFLVVPLMGLMAATPATRQAAEAMPEEVQVRIPELWVWGIACFFGWVMAFFKMIDLRKSSPDRLLPPKD